MRGSLLVYWGPVRGQGWQESGAAAPCRRHGVRGKAPKARQSRARLRRIPPAAQSPAGAPGGAKMRSDINAGIEEGQQVIFPLFVSFWGGTAALRPQAGAIGEGDI